MSLLPWIRIAYCAAWEMVDALVFGENKEVAGDGGQATVALIVPDENGDGGMEVQDSDHPSRPRGQRLVIGALVFPG